MLAETDTVDATEFKSKRIKRGSDQEHPNHMGLSKFMDRLVKWMREDTTPEYQEFQHRRMQYILMSDLSTEIELNQLHPGDFPFREEVEKRWQLVMSFLHLDTSASTIGQCRFYFKKYPFQQKEVSREDHARNMVEFYVGSVYILRSRLKAFLNKLKEVCPEIRIDVAATIKSFDKIFDKEIRMRNGVTHREPFADVAMQKMFVTRMMAVSPKVDEALLKGEHLRTYRRFMNAWAVRARKRAETVDVLIDELAATLAEKAAFLSD